MSRSRVDLSVAIPFAIFTIIWGTTWIVIRDQLGTVPAQWSVTYRFAIAAVAMAALARWKGEPLLLGRAGMAVAALLGFLQFVVNFNAVYMAEHHITSGLVATVFALLLIPNSLLAWAFLGQRPSSRFAIGSALAVAGIALLFEHELSEHPARTGAIMVGIALTLVGMLGASAANVFQALERVKRFPLFTLLTWAMVFGALFDGLIAFAVAGPPTIETRPGYWVGVVYLARVRLGAGLQPLSARRPQDRPGQGGLFQRDGADHRDGFFDLARRLSLDRAGDCRRAAGAGRHGDRAQPQPNHGSGARRRLISAASPDTSRAESASRRGPGSFPHRDELGVAAAADPRAAAERAQDDGLREHRARTRAENLQAIDSGWRRPSRRRRPR